MSQRHSTIWIFAQIMRAPGIMAELCARFGTKAPTLSRTLALLRKHGLIYVRAWANREARTVKWSAIWDAQTTPFELADAAKPAPKHKPRRVKGAAGNPVTAMARPASCSNALRASGKPYPRTCASCGLGPCKGGA